MGYANRPSSDTGYQETINTYNIQPTVWRCCREQIGVLNAQVLPEINQCQQLQEASLCVLITIQTVWSTTWTVAACNARDRHSMTATSSRRDFVTRKLRTAREGTPMTYRNVFNAMLDFTSTRWAELATRMWRDAKYMWVGQIASNALCRLTYFSIGNVSLPIMTASISMPPIFVKGAPKG